MRPSQLAITLYCSLVISIYVGVPPLWPSLFPFPYLSFHTESTPVAQNVSLIEICDNGLDDDNDGFVDLFDSDCPCDPYAYQAFCELNCEQIPDTFQNIKMKLKWQSEVICNEDHNYPNIVVGDVNSDGIIDVVTKKYITGGGFNNFTKGFEVFSGLTGQKLADHNSIPRNIDEESHFITIGDIDRDGMAEFFYTREDTIICVRADGTIRWKSDVLNEEGGYCVNLADFNGDGIPEAYKGNNIVNAQTGRLLARGNDGGGCNMYTADCSISHTIAADLLPAPGLELAAGNTVYEVSITNVNGLAGNTMNAVRATNAVRDGLTSIGDIDGDQQLDVIVVRSDEYNDNGGIWVWNPRTRNIIARANAGSVGGIAFIGNVTGDCKPEIGINFREELIMYRYNGSTNLQVLYNLNTSDDSGYTGVTMFDFNQDGKNELVYRDETLLRIMEGSTGTTLASYPVRNGTGMEYPVIADVDGDGEAEILVSGNSGNVTQQRLFCFESNGAPWAPARSVWNQPGYHVTNVNDDLTIPNYPQNQAKELIGYENCLLQTCPAPYNAFMVQATYRTQEGCVQFPAIDLEVKILSIECEVDSVVVCYSISNQGDHALIQKNVGIALWPTDPAHSTSAPIAKRSILLGLEINEADTFCVTLSSLNLPDSIFMVVNDPGNIPTPYTFPLTDLPECRYANNIDSLDIDFQTIASILDTSLCEGQSFLFHDSLITQSGTYIIPGKSCDTIFHLFLSLYTNDTIDLTQSICSGDSIFFGGNWLTSSGQYQDQSFNSRGCDSTTYMDLTVASQILVFDTINICQGDSVWLIDQWAFVQGSYTSFLSGILCDTSVQTWLIVFTTYLNSVSTAACPGDTIIIDGQLVVHSDTITEEKQSVRGCDSIIITKILFLPGTQAPVITVDCDQSLITASIDVDPIWFPSWSNGQTGNETIFNTPGPGHVILSNDAGCEEKYEFILPPFPNVEPLSIWIDTTILENHSLEIHLNLNPTDWTVLWTPAEIFSCDHCLNTSVQPTSNVLLTAYLEHISGCAYTHSFSIILEDVVDLYVPNVFSPNGDNINDHWIVTSPEEKIEILKIDIFDRWGDHINEWTNLRRVEWDGLFKGKPLNPGVFAYVIQYRDQDQKEQFRKGNITLVR